MGNEFNIKLNSYKIQHLFKNIRKLNGGKNLLAKKLGITTNTLDEYIKSGQEFLDTYDEQLQPIYELDIDGIDDEITAHKSEYIQKFLELDGTTTLSDKNKNAFEVYFIEQKELMKERIIFDFQKQIITNIKWSDNELENKRIILLMLFKLIYDRGQMSLDEELLYLKNKYAKTSSKHVAIVVKDLERRNKEDFGEEKNTTDNSKTMILNQFNNFTHFAIQHDKAKGILKHNTAQMLPNDVCQDDDILDVDINNQE